jgi:hypothetical protein
MGALLGEQSNAPASVPKRDESLAEEGHAHGLTVRSADLGREERREQYHVGGR